MRPSSLSQNGFTLAELMMAIGIIAIVFLGAATLLKTQNLLFGNLQIQTSRDNLRGVLMRTFANQNLCQKAFTSAVPPTVFNFTKAKSAQGMGLNIYLDGGSTVIKSGDPGAIPAPTPTSLSHYNLAYEYVAFRNALNIGVDQNNPGNTLYEGSVVMKTDKLTGTNNIIGGTAMALLTVGNLTLSVDATNHISSCQSAFIVNTACASFGGAGGTGTKPTDPQCAMNSPCAPGNIFLGNDPTTGAAICHLPCKVAGQGLVYKQGVLTCQAP